MESAVSMQNPPTHKPNNNYRTIILVVFILFVLIGVSMAFSAKKSNNTGDNMATVSVTPSMMQKTNQKLTIPTRSARIPLGSLSIIAPGNKTTYAKGETITLTVKGNAGDKHITGYDLLLGFNPSQLDVVEVKSSVPELQLFQFRKQDHISVTATKSLTAQSNILFANTDIVTITVKPKVSGVINVSILDTSGKESTKIVDDQTNIYTPTVSGITINVN